MVHYTLPAAITLPFAAVYMAFYGTHYVNNVTVLEGSPSDLCNCTHLKITKGGNIVSKLTEINVNASEESRAEIVYMLDSLKSEWVIENKTDWFSEVIQNKYINFLNDKSGHFNFLLLHLWYFLASHLIMKHSVIGILSKIIIYRVKDLVLYPLPYLALCRKRLADYLAKTLRKPSSTDPDEEVEDGTDVFVECSSANLILKTIDSEEVLAKGNQPEEKHLQSTRSDTDNGYESFVQAVHLRDDAGVRISTPRDENLTAETGPEQFTQYLHQRQKTTRREISFTEDGYIEEDESGDESLCNLLM